jgi:hypothetical protein
MHWGISYLREDIQDLRQDVRALHTRIDARFALLLTVMIGLNGLVIGSVVAALRFYLPAQYSAYAFEFAQRWESCAVRSRRYRRGDLNLCHIDAALRVDLNIMG